MDTSGAAGAPAETMSVVALSRLQERVLQLRGHLRSALLADSPQTEMIVYTHFLQLYSDFYLPFYGATSLAQSASPSRAGASAEVRFALSAYTQDMLAACVFLLDPAALPTTFAVPTTPPQCEAARNEANASHAYVSAAQRRFCGLVFLHTCWCATALPLHDVLHALYPLLEPGTAGSTQTSAAAPSSAPDEPPHRQSAAENRIAADLFAQQRFASRKCLLRDTLNGLVLTRSNGLLALLRVLLLSDRVETGATSEAAQLVVRLLTAPVAALWRQRSAVGETGAGVVSYVSAPLSAEDQVQLLAPQLLPLLEEHAEVTEAAPAAAGAAARPRFLARLDSAHLRLPPETLEQRLHLGVTMLLNALVRVPPRTSPTFARCYRLLFYTNKYVLSPGFGSLSLRRDAAAAGEDEVIAALRRLTSIVKGVSLGAGGGALAQLLPPTAAGVLNLCALVSRGGTAGGAAASAVSPPLRTALRGYLSELLSNPSLHELSARALVGSCVETRAHSYATGDAVVPHLRYTGELFSCEMAVAGLRWVLLDVAAASPAFVSVCVDVMAEACATEMFAAGVESVSPGATRPSAALAVAAAVVETPPLVLLLEHLSLEAAPEALFGPGDVSLAATLELLARLLGLSAMLHRWVLGLLEHLLSPANVEAHIGSGGTPVERRVVLARLQRCARTLLASLTVLSDPAQHASAVHAVVAADGEAEEALRAVRDRVCGALKACLDTVETLLAKTEAAPLLPPSAGSGGDLDERATAVCAELQQLTVQLLSALDSHAAVNVAVTLAALARRVDDAVIEVSDPLPLRTAAQSLLYALARVLHETDDVGAAVRAVHCVAWLGMYRFDSADSSFVAGLLWEALAVAARPPWWMSAATRQSAAAPSAAASRLCRLRVRMLDVLLSWIDYDEDGRTLRNVDDSLRRTRGTALYDLLVTLCHGSQDALVQVAAVHLVGAYALAVQPRVPISTLCDLCRDVFRLSPHAMAKAAGAAALGKLVAVLCQPSSDAALHVLTELDLGTLQTLAAAMSSYRGRPTAPGAAAEVDMHDIVIQQHGRDMMALLRAHPPCLAPSRS
ncbi:hypothetical protein NESM_000176300 [Novymonas esmeraldas]|uniref:Uncharacterized protein n=1 Tax=Novymonas esmeraldas TaxID=1808958 RepID=A0AAW0F7W7_9TRYP